MHTKIDGPRFLRHGARRLASPLEPSVIAARAVALAVPALGDCCLLDLADGHGGLVRAAEAHAGPGRHVVVTPAGRPGTSEADRLRRLVGHPIPPGTSRLVVPLTDRGRCVGAMTFASDDGARVHGPEQRVLARQLARLVARAVDDARLRQERMGGPRFLSDVLHCHACQRSADLCDVAGLTGLGWCTTCLEGSLVPTERVELGGQG